MHSRSRARAGRSPRFVAAIATWLALAAPASAQYMYLDSNGDGVHTKADVVNPKGTTRVAVWLITDRNRDGTKVPCSTEATLTGFRVRLSASNGAVRWGAFTPDPPIGTDYEAQALDSLSCAAWYELPAPLPAGKHRLGTATLEVLSGTPSVAILPAPPEYPAQGTTFSSGCIDQGLNPVHLLDNDWHDVDGLAYGGRANIPPVLTAAAQFPVRAGFVAAYHIRAHDEDGDPITFRAVPREGVAPPSFIRVKTLDAGHGDAVGEVELTADSCMESTWLFTLEASDGIWGDRKEVEAPVERVARPVPVNPMGPARAPRGAVALPPLRERVSGPSVASLTGEWEWVESPPGRTHPWFGVFSPGSGPVHAGTRRRLVLRKDRSYETYVLSSGKVRLAEQGTYALGSKENPFRFSPGGDFSAWVVAPDTLCLAPWRSNDAATDRYVRVPTVIRSAARLDTTRLLEPLGHPAIHEDGSISLNASMREALRRYDPAFHPYTPRDWPGPSNYEYGEGQIPWAVIGDFDGDMIQDAALYGVSGKDEVVAAVLSAQGNIRVVEVARRVATKEGTHPSLELIPRGTVYSPCWARKGTPETDAIGIVSPGVARFDYALANGQFVLYAPVP